MRCTDTTTYLRSKQTACCSVSDTVSVDCDSDTVRSDRKLVLTLALTLANALEVDTVTEILGGSDVNCNIPTVSESLNILSFPPLLTLLAPKRNDKSSVLCSLSLSLLKAQNIARLCTDRIALKFTLLKQHVKMVVLL